MSFFPFHFLTSTTYLKYEVLTYDGIRFRTHHFRLTVHVMPSAQEAAELPLLKPSSSKCEPALSPLSPKRPLFICDGVQAERFRDGRREGLAGCFGSAGLVEIAKALATGI